MSEKKLNRAVVFWVSRWQVCPRQSCFISLADFFLEILPVVQTLLLLQPQDKPDQGDYLELSDLEKKKSRGIFLAGSSSIYNPNFILCFLSKSSLLKYHLDKGIWFRKGVWHLVKHLTLCQIITEKLSEIHSWIISINCVTTSCPSTGDNVFHTSGKHEGSICVRKLGSRQKYLFQKNLLADWWGGEDSSSYIKRTSSQRD